MYSTDLFLSEMNTKRKIFTEHEKKILVSIVLHPKLHLLPVLQKIDNSSRGRHEKQMAWNKILHLFNKNVQHSDRTVNQLKTLWKNLKGRAARRRKQLASSLIESRKHKVETVVEMLDEKPHGASKNENLPPSTGKESFTSYDTNNIDLPLSSTTAKTLPQIGGNFTLGTSTACTNLSQSFAIATKSLKIDTVSANKNLSQSGAMTSHFPKPLVTTTNLPQSTATTRKLSQPSAKTTNLLQTCAKTVNMSQPVAKTTVSQQSNATIVDLPSETSVATVNLKLATLASLEKSSINNILNNADWMNSAKLPLISAVTKNSTATLTSSFPETSNAAAAKLYTKGITNNALHIIPPTNITAIPTINGLSKTKTIVKISAAASQAVKVTDNLISVETSATTRSKPLASSVNSNKPPVKTLNNALQDATKKNVDILLDAESSDDSFYDSSEFEISYTSSNSSKDDLPLGATAATVTPRTATEKRDVPVAGVKNNSPQSSTACLVFPHASNPDSNSFGKSLLQVENGISDHTTDDDVADPFVLKMRKDLLTKTISFRKQQHLLEQEIFELKKKKITLELNYWTKKSELEKKIAAKKRKR